MHQRLQWHVIIAVVSVSVLLIAPARTETQTFTRWTSSCDGVDHTAGIALADLDGDGDLDVVFANGRHLAEKDWVYSNDGKGSFYGRRALENGPDRSYGVAIGDFDNDGDLDAVVANDAGDRSIVYRNDGRANFTAFAALGSGIQARRAVALGDLDGDGDLDAVLVGVGQDHIYLNEGAGRRWTERPFGSREGNDARATGVALADLDGDKDLDIVVPGRYEGDSVMYLNDGKAGFSDTRRFGVAADDPTSVAVGDIDGDGDADIVTGNWKQPHVVYVNDGHGRFNQSSTFGTGKEQTWSIALGDIDLDGDLDVVVGNADVGFWTEDLDGDKSPDRFGQETRGVPSRVYVNDGHGRFTAGVSFSTGGDNTRPIALGDVDGDGDLDIVMGNDCQPNHVFFNSLRTPSRKMGTGPQAPAFAPRALWRGKASRLLTLGPIQVLDPLQLMWYLRTL